MDSQQQTTLQYLQEIRDKIRAVDFMSREGVESAKNLLTDARNFVNIIIDEDGAKDCYQEIIDIATQENLLKVNAKDFAEILGLVNNIMWRRDFNIQSSFIDQAIASFSEEDRSFFSTPSDLSKLMAPISQMGFSAQHFSKSAEVLQDMVCKTIKESAIISDRAVEITASVMLHVKNIGFLDQDNAKEILTKINRYYSRKAAKTKRQDDQSAEKTHQGKIPIPTPVLESETFNNIFEIVAYYESVFDLAQQDKMSEGFRRRFFSGEYKRKLDTSDFQREIFEKIYQNIAGIKKIALERDGEGRVIKATIDDLIEVELEGKYCEIGKFFKAGDIVIRNKQTGKIISIIELDGKEHEASIDGIYVDRGKYFSRDKIIEKNCRIPPLFIKYQHFANYNKDKEGFIAKLLQGVRLEIAKDFVTEAKRKEELERQEVARKQAEEEREVARKQEEAKKKAEENQRQKQEVSERTVNFLGRANEEIIAKMQAAIAAAKAPSDPSESLQQYKESLQQQLSQLQEQINKIFSNPAIEQQEARDEEITSSTDVDVSEDFEQQIVYPAAEADSVASDELEYDEQQELSESPKSEDGAKEYNEIEKNFARHLLQKNHQQAGWILEQVVDYDLNSFVFLDGEHQGKTAMQFAIETKDRDLATILYIYNVTNLPTGYRLQKDHPFFDYLQKILKLEPEPQELEVPDDIGDDMTFNPLQLSADDSKRDDDSMSKIVATISDSFERGDLRLFENTIMDLDGASLERIRGEALFSHGAVDKMTLASFAIFWAMSKNKLQDGFIKVLGEIGCNFFDAKIVKGKSSTKALRYVVNMTFCSQVEEDVANKFFNELASFGVGKAILALAFHGDIRDKFFLNLLQEKFTPQEILQAMARIGKGEFVIVDSAMSEVGQHLIVKVAISGDDDLVKFFVENYDLLVERHLKVNKFYFEEILKRAVKENNAKVVSLVWPEYLAFDKNDKLDQEFKSSFEVPIKAILDEEDAKKRDLDKIDWNNPPKDRQKLKEILLEAISKRHLDVANKAIGALEFDAQTQAEDDAQIMPKIVESGNFYLLTQYVKKIASKESDKKARREIELETLYKCFECALRRKSYQLVMGIFDSFEYGKEFLVYRCKTNGRGAAFLAAEMNSLPVFKRFLTTGTSEYSQVDQNGYSPLHLAVERGNHLIAILVADSMVRLSKSPRVNFYQILEFLQSKTKGGETVMDIAARISRTSDDQSLKYRCVKAAKFIRNAIKTVEDAKEMEIKKYPNLAKSAIEKALQSNPFQGKELGEVVRRGCNLRFAMPVLLNHLLPFYNTYPESRIAECVEVVVQNGVKFDSSWNHGAPPLEYAIDRNLKDVAKIILKNKGIITADCVLRIWFPEEGDDKGISNFLFENYPIQFAKILSTIDFQSEESSPSQEYCRFLRVAVDANMVDVVKMMLQNRQQFTCAAKDDAGDKNQQKCQFLTDIIHLPKSNFLSRKAQSYLFRLALEQYKKEGDLQLSEIKQYFQEQDLQDFEAACAANEAPSAQQVEAKELDINGCKDAIKKAMCESDLSVVEVFFDRIQELETEKEKYNLEFVELALKESRFDAIKLMLKKIGEEQAFAILCQAIKDKSDAAVDAILHQQRQIFAEENPPKPDRWKNFINQKKDGKTILEIALEVDSQTQLRAMTLGNAIDQDAACYQLEWKNSGFLFLLIEKMASLEKRPEFAFYRQLFIDILNHQESVLEESEYKKFVNQTNANGSSLLFWAIKYLPGNLLYGFLIDKGVKTGKIGDEDENKNLCFAACRAMNRGRVAVVMDFLPSIFGITKELLKSSLNFIVDAKSKKTLLMEAAKCSNDYLLKIMLEQQTGCNLAACDKEENSIWHYLASASYPANGDLSSLERCSELIFEATGAKMSSGMPKSMRSALISASGVGNLNRKGESPLEVAIKSGNIQIAKILVKNGAIENGAFQQKSLEESTVERAKILHLAAVKKTGIAGGDADLIAAIIARQEANCGSKKAEEVKNQTYRFVNYANKSGNTALHTAATCGNLFAIEGLLKNGAKMDVEVANKMGQSPFHVAVAMGHQEVVSALLDHQKTSKSPSGSKGGQDKVVAIPKAKEKLIDQPTTVDPKLRPIEIAVERDNFEMAKFLLKEGATLNRDIAMAMFKRAKPEQKEKVKKFLEENKIPILVLSDETQPPQNSVSARSASGAGGIGDNEQPPPR